MSLWQDYQSKRTDAALTDDVSSAMYPVLFHWLIGVAERLGDPVRVAMVVKNKFRIDATIPRTKPHNYLDAPPAWRYASFIMSFADDTRLFFTVLDYLVQELLQTTDYPERLERILDDANHKYRVSKINGVRSINEYVSDNDLKLMEHLLSNSQVYASEFRDAFSKAYGIEKDKTGAAGEAFQSLESALKYYLGEDKRDNLGALLAWLRSNKNRWDYIGSSSGQNDAQEQFIELVNFVNKSYRKVKHGQASEKLVVDEKHAEVILRAVSLAIFQLENTIKLKKISS